MMFIIIGAGILVCCLLSYLYYACIYAPKRERDKKDRKKNDQIDRDFLKTIGNQNQTSCRNVKKWKRMGKFFKNGFKINLEEPSNTFLNSSKLDLMQNCTRKKSDLLKDETLFFLAITVRHQNKPNMGNIVQTNADTVTVSDF